MVFNGADNIGGTANAETFTVANAAANAVITGLATGTLKYTDTGTITANGGWTGDIDFNNKAGTFILGANSILTGAVSSTGGINGTLKALGSGSITGVVNGVDIFEFSGGNGTAFDLAGNTTVNNVLFTNSNAASGTININADLNSGQVTFNMGNANGGTLVINAPTTVGDIVNAANGNIIINADFTITDPDAGGIHNITIKDNTTYTIDSINGNVDLLANGAKIIFEGADSELDLINTSNANDRTFTLHNNLNPSNAQDEFGIVRIGATKKDLTIASNDGPFTIGQDNTHRLKEFIVDVAGDIEIDNVVVFTKLLSMNSTGQVTFNQELDLGAGGLIVFGDVGTLIANGDVTGDIDFHGKAGTFELDDGAMIDGSVLGTRGVAGTLNFIGDGNVTGNIGTDAANSPANINIQGDNTKNVTIANDIFVGNINFTNGGVLQLSGNLTTPNIDFGANGGTLEFNGNNTYNLNAIIANGQNGILNVFTTLKSTEASIGTVKTINIGQVFRKRRETPEP